MEMDTQYRRGDKIGGRYEVDKVLPGGMGEVYLCLDLKWNSPFALKNSLNFAARSGKEAMRLMVSSGEFTIVIGCRLGFFLSSAFSSDRSTDSCLLIVVISPSSAIVSRKRLHHRTPTSFLRYNQLLDRRLHRVNFVFHEARVLEHSIELLKRISVPARSGSEHY